MQKGYLYANTLAIHPIEILDLNPDPYNPVYAGNFSGLTTHDCYADNDTVYGAHLGVLSMIDVSDKSNPVLLGTAPTPGAFTHNTWLLDNHQYLLTTDEAKPSFVTAYDISDPADIKEVCRVSSNDGYGAVAHNTQVLNDWAITGWYKDGVVIADAHRPENLVVAGRYDTWLPNQNADFLGCWGVYSYLPSGNIVASNYLAGPPNRGDVLVLTPDYQRACYLEGMVINSNSGFPINDVTVEIIGNPYSIRRTAVDGIYKTGQTEEGTVLVSFRSDGFCADTTTAILIAGEITTLNVALVPCPPFSISGQVINAATGAPVPYARVLLRSALKTYQTQAYDSGIFFIPNVQIGTYDIYFSQWGWNTEVIAAQYLDAANTQMVLPLNEELYYDDFLFNFLWTKTGPVNNGTWHQVNPNATFLDSLWQNVSIFGSPDTIHIGPGADVGFDANSSCYVTGKGFDNTVLPWFDDVDGTTTLTSPFMQLGDYEDALLSFWYWFFDGGPDVLPSHHLEVRAISKSDSVTIYIQQEPASAWRFSGEIPLGDFITLSNDMRIQFIVSTGDTDPFNELYVTKAAVDAFKVVPNGLISTTSIQDHVPSLLALPNPSAEEFMLKYHWPGAQNLSLEIRNTMGQVVMSQTLPADSGSIIYGEDWSKGVYFAVLRSEGNTCKVVKMIKH